MNIKSILSNPLYLLIGLVVAYFAWQWWVKKKAEDAAAAKKAEKEDRGK